MERANSVALRFATLFGPSMRMRLDLLPNDFAYRAVTERSIVLFDAQSVRTFLHVNDAVRAYMLAYNHPEKMVGEVFNVGDERMNVSKLQIAETIKGLVPVEIINSRLADLAKRNFIASFEKFKRLGFERQITLELGLQDLIRIYSWYQPLSRFKNI